jgi:plasmid stabilization system protein ParE
VTLPVVFTQAARADTLHAIGWYDDRLPGLGQNFAAELDGLVNRVGGNPLQFPEVRRDVRRAILPRFPYGVFFRVLPDVIQVIACLHTSRSPRRWRRRV